jgi:PPK2 family polyphosphate:nucleotide phosphotransferase
VASLARTLRVRPGRRVGLAEIDPRGTPGARDKAASARALARNLERLDSLQFRLFAEGRRALLVVLQGMDTSGKDGVVRHVMTGLNPAGCRVTSFKAPSAEERAHDFLWRIHRAVPAAGEVGIFNRSHYEDVLIVRVHGLVPKGVWKRRYAQINAFERHLVDSGVTLLKCFLHISPGEQLERLRARLDDPTRHWKVNPADFDERARWDDYTEAYEDALRLCSTDAAPWHVVPADRKWYRDLAISTLLVETLEDMDPRFPKVELDLEALRKRM